MVLIETIYLLFRAEYILVHFQRSLVCLKKNDAKFQFPLKKRIAPRLPQIFILSNKLDEKHH